MLDRGNIDPLADARTGFRFRDLRPGSWRGVAVTGRGSIGLLDEKLWLFEEPCEGDPYLLGQDANGIIYLGWLAENTPCPPAAVRFAPLTETAPLLSDDEAMLAAQAVALARWHHRDKYCTRCGNRVDAIEAGWASKCESCGNVEYPRTDPVVIVRVTDGADRILLAHNTAWNRPMLSLPAGYIEAGETPRRAIERELMEEVRVAVRDPEYLGAQPWPGPRSLMLAFHAQTVHPEVDPVPDQVEIDYARFFDREEYYQALVEQRIFAPRSSSIAAAMLTDWLGAPLPYPQ